MENVTKNFLNVNNNNFNFFLIWANENWNNDLINCYEININNWNKHFLNLLKYFKDKNYYKIDNKPVFFILHYYLWSENVLEEFIKYLNNKCIENNFNGIYFSTICSFNLPTYKFINSYYVNMPAWKNCKMFGNVDFVNNTHILDYNVYLNHKELDFINNIDLKNDLIFNVFPSFNNYVRNYHKETIQNFKTINHTVENFHKLINNNFINFKKYKNNSKIFLINDWNEWGGKYVY